MRNHADDQARVPPASLGELLAHVIDSRGFRSLADLSRHTSIPYQTLWAWQTGSRNLKRPPAPIVLQTLAADLGLPEELVFRAAGRVHGPDAIDPELIEIAHLVAPAHRDRAAGGGAADPRSAERARMTHTGAYAGVLFAQPSPRRVTPHVPFRHHR